VPKVSAAGAMHGPRAHREAQPRSPAARQPVRGAASKGVKAFVDLGRSKRPTPVQKDWRRRRPPFLMGAHARAGPVWTPDINGFLDFAYLAFGHEKKHL
jgi:hypothetical protein